MYMTIIGTIDIAQVALYAFWIFFFGLVVWLQRENMREGYPLVSEKDEVAGAGGFFPLPSPKTFKLPHGGGETTVPAPETEREPALRQIEPWVGSPFEPTGDPLADGVGPAAWAQRADKPDLTAHGEIKIRPLRSLGGFSLATPRLDPRGLPVTGGDGEVAGTVHDLWVDQSEQLIRYIEVALPGAETEAGAAEPEAEASGETAPETAREGGEAEAQAAPEAEAEPRPKRKDARPDTRLLPMTLARVTRKGVRVHSLYADQFAGVPTTASPDSVTLLEEDVISAYWCGGKLYADRDRLEPAI